VVVAVFLLGAGAGTALSSVVAADFRDATSARLLMVVTWEMARLLAAPFLVLIAAAALSGFRYGVFGKTFSSFSLVFASLPLLALLPSSPAGMMGVLSFGWVAVTGLLLAFRDAPPPVRLERTHSGGNA
jgi:hypothetical protein